MATLHVDQDLLAAGTWRVTSDHPAALAAIPDALLQVSPDAAADMVSAWALHPTEQAGVRSEAYREEQHELGSAAQFEVVELPRPHQHNVVWVDRFHLCATAIPPSVTSRLLGMYVGTAGRCVTYLHHTSISAQVVGHVMQLPLAATAGGRASGAQLWSESGVAQQCRLVVNYDSARPTSVDLRCSPHVTSDVIRALQHLSTIVAPWAT